MLAHESTYCVSVPGGNAEVSLNGLRAILGQVETELYHSEIYGQMLSSLKALPDDLSRQVQSMMKAVGREAIRLALRKMVRKKSSSMMQPNGQSSTHAAPPPPPLKVQPLAPVNAAEPKVLDRTPPTLTVVPPMDTQLPPAVRERKMLYPSTAVSSVKPLKINPHKKLSKRELAQKTLIEAREAYLQELGQTIRQVRQEKSWSHYHLHLKTQVPLHQLEALENGRFDRLPEDIYLQGFIRQIGNALGLDGNHLAASVPMIEAAVVPSWQKPKTGGSTLRINSMQIYLGYAALMAGGIAWVSHQSLPQHTGSTPSPSTATVAPSPKAAPVQATTSKGSPKEAAALSVKQGTVTPVQGNVAPPETSPL